jgi:hypothetical protein
MCCGPSKHTDKDVLQQLDYNLLYRWFVCLGVDDLVQDHHSTFSKDRDRILDADVAANFPWRLEMIHFMNSLRSDPKIIRYQLIKRTARLVSQVRDITLFPSVQ